jgi:tricarballylate dehydrogenase
VTREVIVVGAGNAGLVAALAAHEAGARVRVLEKASRDARGGNSRYSMGAFAFGSPTLADLRALLAKPDPEWEARGVRHYPPEEFGRDLMRISVGEADPELTRLLVEHAYPTAAWLRDQGLRWELILLEAPSREARPGQAQAYNIGWVRTVGEGPGLMDALFNLVVGRGIEVRYDTAATGLMRGPDGRIGGVLVEGPAGAETLAADAVVLASGGFEASAPMRARHLGPLWERVKVRGTAHNTGDGLRMALAVGAQPYGDWAGCHSTPVDVAAPPYGSPEATYLSRRVMYPFGVMVNAAGRRFVDEGEDLSPLTYARIGRRILEQAGGVAYQLFDAKTDPETALPYQVDCYRGATQARADSIAALAARLGLEAGALGHEIEAFNRAVDDAVRFDPNPLRLDGKGTRGLTPPKSNWAQRLDAPPFVAYPVTAGITFTYGGLRIDPEGAVLDTGGRPIPGLFAAGELTGGFFANNYVGGSGLTRGAVTGRLAGRSAARKG